MMFSISSKESVLFVGGPAEVTSVYLLFYSSGKCRYNCYLYFSGFYCIYGIVRPRGNTMSYNSYLHQLLILQQMCGRPRGLLSNCRGRIRLGGRPRVITVTVKIATEV